MPKLNILKHKSWHVLKKENLERIKKDEDEANQTKKMAEKKTRFLENEHKLRILRRNAINKYYATSLSQNKQLSNNIEGYDQVENGELSTISANAQDSPHQASQKSRHHFLNLFEDEDILELGFEHKKETDIKKHDNYISICSKKSSENKSWYLRSGDLMSEEKKSSELKKKIALDPIRSIKDLKNSSSPKERTNIKTHTGTDMEKLRKERLQRELEERHRLAKLSKR